MPFQLKICIAIYLNNSLILDEIAFLPGEPSNLSIREEGNNYFQCMVLNLPLGDSKTGEVVLGLHHCKRLATTIREFNKQRRYGKKPLQNLVGTLRLFHIIYLEQYERSIL